MPVIKVDNQVYQGLQQLARPFMDRPNDVLRRLLRLDNGDDGNLSFGQDRPRNPGRFSEMGRVAREILAAEFADDFSRVAPYRCLYEGRKALIYFQNFNKMTDHLWFRIGRAPLEKLAVTRKRAFLCLTCPAMHFAYLIPYGLMAKRQKHFPDYGKGDSLVINVKVGANYWTELQWKIGGYRIAVNGADEAE